MEKLNVININKIAVDWYTFHITFHNAPYLNLFNIPAGTADSNNTRFKWKE